MNSTKNILQGSENENVKSLASSTWIKSQRQTPNLKKILTNEKFNKSEEAGVNKCGHPRCKTCEIIVETKDLMFKGSEKKFDIRAKMDCTSKNVIY